MRFSSIPPPLAVSLRQNAHMENPHCIAESMRVLVVDDDPVAREQLAQALTRQGHDVVVLGSGQSALSWTEERSVDAVVVDVSLPDMRGDLLARALRERSRGADLGIVLVSMHSDGELERLRDCASADAVVTKAEVDSELVAQVTNARRRRRLTFRPGRLPRARVFE